MDEKNLIKNNIADAKSDINFGFVLGFFLASCSIVYIGLKYKDLKEQQEFLKEVEDEDQSK